MLPVLFLAQLQPQPPQARQSAWYSVLLCHQVAGAVSTLGGAVGCLVLQTGQGRVEGREYREYTPSAHQDKMTQTFQHFCNFVIEIKLEVYRNTTASIMYLQVYSHHLIPDLFKNALRFSLGSVGSVIYGVIIN